MLNGMYKNFFKTKKCYSKKQKNLGFEKSNSLIYDRF